MTNRVRREKAAPAREDTRWLVRSVSLPVQECLSHPWSEFLRLLHGAWKDSTLLANWASQTLARLDVLRLPGMQALPKWEAPDLYALAFGRDRQKEGRQLYGCPECSRRWKPSDLDGDRVPDHGGKQPCAGVGQEARELPRKVLPPVVGEIGGWDGARIGAATLLRKVARKYGRERYQVLWRRERRTAEYLYPYPYPVHQQAWSPAWHEPEAQDGKEKPPRQPVVLCALPGARVSLRLRQGAEFAQALRVFDRLVGGEVAQQELTLSRQRSYWDGARRDSDRLPGGGHRNHYRIMARIAYRFEAAACTAQGVWRAVTGGDPFLLLSTADRPEWVLHAPWVRQWIEAHAAFRQRFADDMKFEKRWPRGQRRRMNRRQERGCDKENRRLRTFEQQAAAMLVGHAQRNGCGRIVWDDSDRSFADPFPWYALREAVSCKCDEAGIVFEVLESEEVAPESGETTSRVE